MQKDIKQLTNEELLEYRRNLESDVSRYENLQLAKKLCLNSAYGALGSKFFRFFDIRLAEAITLEGQLSNRWVADNINIYLNGILKQNKDYVIYGDTDSLLVSLSDLVFKVIKNKKSNEEIVDFLMKAISTNIQPKVDEFCSILSNYVNSYRNALSYKLEKICSSGVFVAKKRYALNVYSNEGIIYSEPKVKVTGLEIVKSSTPKLVRKALKHCIKLVLEEKEIEMQQYIKEFKLDFFNSNAEDISFPRGVNGIDQYYDSKIVYKKGTPIHVRGCILYNKFLLDNNLNSKYEFIKDGDKIKFIYLKMPNSIGENVIAFPDKLPKEFGLHEYINYELMFSKVFIEPLKSVTDVAKFEIEKRNRIEDFFCD